MAREMARSQSELGRRLIYEKRETGTRINDRASATNFSPTFGFR
jgi:hypothetical protein